MSAHSQNIAQNKLDIISIALIDGKKCVTKKLKSNDFSYLLETEASRRLLGHDQMYSIVSLYKDKHNTKYIVSEYVRGHDFFERLTDLSEHQIISLLCQMMLLINIIHVANMSHNDLHLRNIRVQDTVETTLEYDIGGRTYRLPTFGVKAVIIDFGLSTIMTPSGRFKIAPLNYSGDCFLRLDIRYDMHRFLGAFIGSILHKFPLDKMPCVSLIKYIHENITGPKKVNTDAYFALNGLVPREFKKYLLSDWGVDVKFTTTFLNYVIIIERSKNIKTYAEKHAALMKLTREHIIAPTEEDLVVYLKTKVMPKRSEWVFAIAQLWDEFIDSSSAMFKETVDKVFNTTWFQNPIDLVDVIITSFLI